MEINTHAHVTVRLERFVILAGKCGKYSDNTVKGYLLALQIVNEELADLDNAGTYYITKHLDDFFRKTPYKKASSLTLQAYKGRVRTIINDYNSYGRNLQKFNAWKSSKTKRKLLPGEFLSFAVDVKADNGDYVEYQASQSEIQKSPITRFVKFNLRKDLQIQMELPINLNSNDIKRILKFLNFEAELTAGNNKIEG